MGAGLLTDITEAKDRLTAAIAAGVSGLTDAEIHELLPVTDEVRRAATVLEVAVLGEIEIRGSHEVRGAKTAAAYAAWQLPMSVEEARRYLRCSRELRKMPLVAGAFEAGRITLDHVRLYAQCEATNPDAFTVAEPELLKHAFEFDAAELGRILAYWRQCADPDGSQKDAERRFEKRTLSVTQAADGMWLIKGQLDPVGGEIFANVLESIDREEFDKDWTEAKAIHGEDTCIEHLSRSPGQRRHDAGVLMARRAGQVTPGAEDHGPRPLITVVMGDAKLAGLCETERGSILDPHDLWRILDRAEGERVVFDSASRPIDVSVKTRFFTGASRRAVQVRDRECAHPSCHEPVTYAHVHHIIEHADGGETVVDNGLIYCPWHHRWHHRQPQPTA